QGRGRVPQAVGHGLSIAGPIVAVDVGMPERVRDRRQAIAGIISIGRPVIVGISYGLAIAHAVVRVRGPVAETVRVRGGAVIGIIEVARRLELLTPLVLILG